MKKFLMPVVSATCLLFLLHCGGVRSEIVRNSETWDHRTPRRLAILPVITEDAGHAAAAEILRRDLYAGFNKRPEFDVLELGVVDHILQSENLLPNDRWQQVSPRQLGEALHVDQLLRVRLTRFGSTYVLIQTNSGAGAEVELLDARTGEVLWKADKEVSASRGLTGIPTGLVSVALEPVRGLGKGQRLDLLRQLGLELVASIDPSHDSDQSSPSAPPEISRGYAMYNEASRYLDIRIIGSPNCRVTFKFPGLAEGYPCEETERGNYTAGFLFPEDMVIPEIITVHSVNQVGAMEQQEVVVQ
ncbi:MAG: GNA1162 family protein [bacterium]|jgi:hypothetical protein